jgi:hypothetical protein
MALVGCLTGLGFWLIGLPSAPALGLIAGIAEFVPIVGPIAASIPAVLVASTLGWESMLWALAIIVVVQQVENLLISPLIVGSRVAIPPAVALFGIVSMGVLFGPLGVLLGFPLAIVFDVAVRRLYVLDMLGKRVEGGLTGSSGVSARLACRNRHPRPHSLVGSTTDRDRTVILEKCVAHSSKRGEALAPQGLQQLSTGYLLLYQDLVVDHAIADEDPRHTLEHPCGLLAAPRNVAKTRAQTKEYTCRQQSTRQRFVVAHKGVLQRLAYDQQNHEIERGHLAHVLLADEANESEQEGVNHEHAKQQLEGMHCHCKHSALLAVSATSRQAPSSKLKTGYRGPDRAGAPGLPPPVRDLWRQLPLVPRTTSS